MQSVGATKGNARVLPRTFQGRAGWVASALAILLVSGCAQQGERGSTADGVPPAASTSAPDAAASNGVLRSTATPDWVRLSSFAPEIQQDIRYAGKHNFVGRTVAGYEAKACWLSRPAAQALKSAQRELASSGLRLKVFDCYRPQAAVDDFVRWSQDGKDQKTKATHYPNVAKSALIQRGYIAARSGHSRASAVDLTVVVIDGQRASKRVRGPLADGQELDMGTPFDFFDPQSHTENADMPPDVQFNRRWLRSLMQRHGWRNLPQEWWHFSLVNEPYPDSYFDWPVK